MALGHWLAMLLLMVSKSNPAAVSLMRGSSWRLDSGTEAAANCSSSQCASCHVTWRKQGDSTFHWGNETLHFNPVKKTDHGNYTCTVEDSEGRQLKNGTLEILVNYPTENISLSVNNLPPSKTRYKTKEGANVTLSCAVDGFPPPLVKWHKDSGTVKTDNLTLTYGLHQPVGKSFLTSYHVTGAGCVDEGVYVCQAGNSVNKTAPIEILIKLEVECAPKLQDAAKQPWTWSAQRGDTVVVNFTVLSNPESHVAAWRRTGAGTGRGMLNQGDADHSLNETAVDGNARNFVLSHYNVTETGQYMMTVTNGLHPNLTLNYTILLLVDKAVLNDQSGIVPEVEDCVDAVCEYKSYIIGGCVVVGAGIIAVVAIIVLKCKRRTDPAAYFMGDDDIIFRVIEDILPPVTPHVAGNKNYFNNSCNISSNRPLHDTLV
ncbi:neural cell adhesion molecule 1-like [Haliotis cracherodii]|uniref:neural cell adhesion molecule 1-like n=1 Tax=Haliotis cracherodii TaxID=6455 RepID=UPI0039EAC6D1